MKLNDKVALITGGARIGISVAEELSKRGCHVAVTYNKSVAAAREAARRVRNNGRRCRIYKADVTKNQSVRLLIKKVTRYFGGLDILINMASIYEGTPFNRLTEKTWDKILDINLKGTFLTVLHASTLLKSRKGRIINFSDWVAASGRPRYKGFLPYHAAKVGIIGLTEAQALELAPRVLVNALAPGPILPPKNIKNEEVKSIEKVTPLKKWGGASEIAKTVVFLSETDFMTGECVRVDGGRHLL